MSTKIPFKVVIPARIGSTRLPEKILAEIAGKPMIQHVHERAKASGAESVLVATDDERIFDTVIAFGGQACITSKLHPTGTDRIAEAITQLKYPENDIVVNVQGDEPLISPKLIYQVACDLYENNLAEMSTLCEPIVLSEDLVNPSLIKVIRDQKNFALYFSRSAIPYDHINLASAKNPSQHFRHLGLYAYRVKFIKQYVKWPQAPMEKLESLEQLRALWYGAKISVPTAEEVSSRGVDTEADLLRVRAQLKLLLPCDTH